MKYDYLTFESQHLRARAHEHRAQCKVCRFLLVEISEQRNRWRCEFCLRYIEVLKLTPNSYGQQLGLF